MVHMDELMLKRILLSLESLGNVIITDEEGRYTYISKRRQRKDGVSYIGRFVRDIYPDTLVDQCIKTKQSYLLHPLTKTNSDGSVTRLFASYYPLIENDVCYGCFMHVSFSGLPSALEFANLVTDFSRQMESTNRRMHIGNLSTARYSTNDIIGQSEAINQLKLEIAMAARTSSNVLIQGETGTGKELVAHAIHALSQRCASPLIRVNCSAIPENLMESEFFGYEEGAFTGAKRGGKAGKFELASGGTLFLDEVNMLPQSMQPKFLRVIQEREVERVGGRTMIPVNTRIIAAANCPLDDLVKQGSFRQDLYYRLNVIKLRIPPLRERKEDIPLLVNMFISQMNVRLGLDVQDIDSGAMKLLMDYDWPGNIRELQNVIERAVNYAYDGVLNVNHFKWFAKEESRTSTSAHTSKQTPEQERDSIVQALAACKGNKRAAAQMLGWARSTLYEKLAKYNLN